MVESEWEKTINSASACSFLFCFSSLVFVVSSSLCFFCSTGSPWSHPRWHGSVLSPSIYKRELLGEKNYLGLRKMERGVCVLVSLSQIRSRYEHATLHIFIFIFHTFTEIIYLVLKNVLKRTYLNFPA